MEEKIPMEGHLSQWSSGLAIQGRVGEGEMAGCDHEL